jgi:hypothetical protein
MAEGATLALQARKTVNLYRCTAVKISTITGQPCRIPPELVKFVEAPSAQLAKMAYMQESTIPENDDAGSWVVTAKKQGIALDDI